jgi:hypothetical protein
LSRNSSALRRRSAPLEIFSTVAFIAISLHTIDTTTYTLLDLAGVDGVLVEPCPQEQANRIPQTLDSRRWPNIHHLSNSEPLSTSTGVRHRCPDARSMQPPFDKTQGRRWTRSSIGILRPGRPISRYEQIACEQPLCREVRHIPELHTYRLLVIHCLSGMLDISFSR